MLSFLISFAVFGVPQLIHEAPPIAPTDIAVGQQQIELRGPLIARTPDAKLVLFVRDLAALKEAGDERVDAFEKALPRGSVQARLSNTEGDSLALEHTDYIYYKGFAGLVLTEQQKGARATRYDSLSLDATTALPGVRFVWLDHAARTVRDVPPPR